ncbi:MAG: HdeD family acid-resistance protein [Pirellulales bacterium]|nr:HdeD family acid-resistance protein [Planctomycetales bacterium]
MSTEPSNENVRPIDVLSLKMEGARKHWLLFFLLGVLLVIAGVIAIAYPCISSLGVVLVLGAVLIISGVFTIIGAFWAGKWSALLLQLLVGILYVMAGMAIRDAPVASIEVLTMFVAAFFIVVGAFRTIVALFERFPQWGWALLNGVITLAAGLIIYDSLANGAFWVIGLLVGLELLFNGWTWIMLSLMIRQLPEEHAGVKPLAS